MKPTSNKSVVRTQQKVPTSSDLDGQQRRLTLSSSSSSSSSTSSIASTFIETRNLVLENSSPLPLSTSVPQTDRKPAKSQQSMGLSARRYRNSPFGLTRHYLTMPDDGDQFKPKYESDDEEDEQACDSDSIVQQPKGLRLPDKLPKNGQSAANFNLLSDSSSSQHSLNMTNGHWHDYHGKPGKSSPPMPKAGSLKQLDASRLSYCSSSPSGPTNCLESSSCIDPKNYDKHNNMTAFSNFQSSSSASSSSSNSHNQLNNDLHQLKLRELRQPEREANSLLVRFSSIMYATFLVILGCVLHVSELRQKSKNSSDHIYTSTVAIIGIIWLLFLQLDLLRYKRYASKYILIETIFNDHRQKSLQEQRRLAELNPSSRSTVSSSASLVNDRMSMNTEVIFKKTAYRMYQQQAAQDRQSGTYINKRNEKDKQPSGSQTEYRASPCFNQDHLVPAYKFLHGKMGANFYLKCGMAAFCFGHVIHEGLRFGQQVYFFAAGNIDCRDSAALSAHLVTPLYSFYQLFMMFKYSNLVINRHKVLARFGLMHIIGTSVTFWFRTILEEAFEDFVHKMDYFKANKPQLNFTSFGSVSFDGSSLVSLFTSTTMNSIRSSENDAGSGGWAFSSAPSNIINFNNLSSSTAMPSSVTTSVPSTASSMAQSLFSLMSSPISATITPQIVRHLPDSYACAQNTLLTTKSMNTLPYLYPFTIEYNLLLAATFLSLYFNIGKVGQSNSSLCRPSPISSYPHLLQRHKDGLSGSSIGSNIESSEISSSNRIQENLEKDHVSEYKSNFVVNADCHSANKGLFCGFFVLLVTLVTIVIFFVTINKPTHIQLGIKINLIQEVTLTSLILVVGLVGYKQIAKLNRNPHSKEKVTTDDVLMLIPLPFFFIHSLLSFRAETASMSSGSLPSWSSLLANGNDGSNQQNTLTPSPSLRSLLLNDTVGNTNQSKLLINSLSTSHRIHNHSRLFENFISSININNSNSNRNSRNMSSNNNIIINNPAADSSYSSQIDHFKLITVVLNIIVMIEVLVQTNFIIDGMRRCSESRYLRFKKPGRELITFAILLNITYWIVATFETKSVEQYKTEIEYYGPLPYMFISHTTLPVMLFYRYHSSVCLAEIWNRAYKPPKKR